MKSYSLKFTGGMLERGFWLYVWRVRCGRKQLFYVGRTGDSSSQFAASPFARLGQHLDVRAKATANMLLRHIRKAAFTPLTCRFDLVTVGPIYPEQDSLEKHKTFRDVVAPMEAALAEHLRSLGLEVVGKHSSKHKLNKRSFAPVLRRFTRQLGELGIANKPLAPTRNGEAPLLAAQRRRYVF